MIRYIRTGVSLACELLQSALRDLEVAVFGDEVPAMWGAGCFAAWDAVTCGSRHVNAQHRRICDAGEFEGTLMDR